MSTLTPAPRRAVVRQIPVIWVEPASAWRRQLVIWLPGFGGTKESTLSELQDLADRGFVALSFDPFEHGERGTAPVDNLRARVRGNIRRHFWPILGQTAEDASRVIDWTVPILGVEPEVGMGGISMGGDIAVAAAGMDHRIVCAAACIATPDWLRPGSFEPPGEPDAAAQAWYDRCNPLTHLDAYRHRPAISFQCGADDRQVPPDGAARFATALAATYAHDPDRLAVVRHEGVAHSFSEGMWQNGAGWFARHLRGARVGTPTAPP